MGWRDILRSPDPSYALYQAMRANPTASRAADVFQAGFEAPFKALGAFGNAAAIPTRAIAAAAGNMAGTGARPVDVSDYALYGRDMETGLQATQYGDLLAGTLEDAGELAPGGTASKLLRLAGNAVTDPMAAPAFLSGAEAVGALAGGSRMAGTMRAPASQRQVREAGYIRPTPRMVEDVSQHGAMFERKPVRPYSTGPSQVLDTDLAYPGRNTKLGVRSGAAAKPRLRPNRSPRDPAEDYVNSGQAARQANRSPRDPAEDYVNSGAAARQRVKKPAA
jgi:hypothetical protein